MYTNSSYLVYVIRVVQSVFIYIVAATKFTEAIQIMKREGTLGHCQCAMLAKFVCHVIRARIILIKVQYVSTEPSRPFI